GGLLTGLTNVTFETWVTFPGTGNNWQRIFDFGSASTATTGSYVFLTPALSSGGSCRVAIGTAGSNSETAAGGAAANGAALTAGAHQIVVILDDTNSTVSIYVDGTLGQSVGWTGTVASITNTNSYLGRSNFAADAYLGATLDEFRMYRVALTQAQLRTSRAMGPNATFF
ncbi:MAG TPA: LamG-like jellyroll fold domain-containing protein, partial [Polyangiaceae bacterium]